MWNMDEKGLTLGTANKAKVMTRAGWQPPRTSHDGTRKQITVIEACGAKRVMLPPMVVFKGTARYKGWYTEVAEEKHAHFAYSPKSYTTDGIELKKFNAQAKTELAAGSPTPANTASCFLMVTVPTTTFASMSTHGIRRLFWYLTQATQHTY